MSNPKVTVTTKEIVDDLTYVELIQIIKDYDLLEQNCSIGSCLLRQKVNEMCNDKDVVYFHLLAVGLVHQAQRRLLSDNKII